MDMGIFLNFFSMGQVPGDLVSSEILIGVRPLEPLPAIFQCHTLARAAASICCNGGPAFQSLAMGAPNSSQATASKFEGLDMSKKTPMVT